MTKLGIVGSPVQHSLSPLIYSFIASELNISLDYTKYEVSNFSEWMSRNDLYAFNVTVPHKMAAYDSSLITDSSSRLTKAANLMLRTDTGWKSYNTDLIAIENLLRKSRDIGSIQNVLVVGAGGAARAAVVAAIKLQATCVYVVSRNADSAARLAYELRNLQTPSPIKVASIEWLQNSDMQFDVVFHCTKMGMTDIVADSALNELTADVVKNRCRTLFFEMVYGTNSNKFTAVAKIKNIATVSGLAMLVEQALETWKILFPELGELPDNMSERLLQHLNHEVQK